MNEHLQKNLAAMDEKIWLRMLVCFLPGLVLGKLAGIFPSAALGILGTLALIVGVAVFTMWSRLRKLGVDVEDEEEGDDQVDLQAQVASVVEPRPSEETAKLVTELLELFAGSGVAMIDAIHSELLVSPKLTYAEAIELAHRRKRLQVGKL